MKYKIFKIKYANGKFHYIISKNGYAGLIPFAESIRVEISDAITISPASIFELIKYLIKGV